MIQIVTVLSLTLLLVTSSCGYPSGLFSRGTKRSSFTLNTLQVTQCSVNDAINTICYVCGRTYDSMEIYSQCCAGNDANLMAFCEGVFNTR